MIPFFHSPDMRADDAICPPPYLVWKRGYDGAFTWSLEPEFLLLPPQIAAHVAMVNNDVIEDMHHRRELDVN